MKPRVYREPGEDGRWILHTRTVTCGEKGHVEVLIQWRRFTTWSSAIANAVADSASQGSGGPGGGRVVA